MNGLLSALALLLGAETLPPGTQAGDLIFRAGTEAISDLVRAVDQGEYSHVGMLIGHPSHWQVVHATPSEVPGRADGVVSDSLAFYLDPARASGFAVYRVEASADQRTAAVARALSQIERPFKFADPDGTYCTYLIWQAWQAAGVDLKVDFRHLPLPLLAGQYLLPSDLRASPRLRRLDD